MPCEQYFSWMKRSSFGPRANLSIHHAQRAVGSNMVNLWAVTVKHGRQCRSGTTIRWLLAAIFEKNKKNIEAAIASRSKNAEETI